MITPDNPYTLQTAELKWENGVPIAKAFGDVYFSREDGVAESRHVFLGHNRLDERWRKLDRKHGGSFTIIETGFGTGLNFLLAWQLWQQLAPPNWRLHFISVEKYPLRKMDLHRAHQAWPELHLLAGILQDNYPPLVPGQHRRHLNGTRVCLELVFGEATEALGALARAVQVDGGAGPGWAAADAWFLDGFAPSQNPDMWQASLLDAIGALSKPGTTFATFTAAGAIRRGLLAQGFKVDKVAGFGRKREMLCGEKTSTAVVGPKFSNTIAVPWHDPRPYPRPYSSSSGSSSSGRGPALRRVAVIGAGLAGCSTARSLAERGFEVEVLERQGSSAAGASGNPQGMLYTKLSPEPGSLNQFTLSSFLHCLAHYRPLVEAGRIEGELCGVLQLPVNDAERRLHQRLGPMLVGHEWVNHILRERASELAGLPLQDGALHFPQAGWLSPASVCRHWLSHDAIHFREHCEVRELRRELHHWQLLDDEGKVLSEADIVVVASSVDARQLPALNFLPTRSIRGQISVVSASELQWQPKKVICHAGYLAPPRNGDICIGASFDLKNSHCEVTESEHHWNLQQLAKLAPGLLRRDAKATGGRAALRCASPDYHPIVGAVPDVAAFDDTYKDLRKDATRAIAHPGQYLPNLYVNIAHGSRGLSSTPLCAELLASYIAGEFPPLLREQCESLSPARFLIRDLKRRRR